MKYFTKAQIEEIRRALATEGVKDTDLDNAHALSGDELVAIVQDGVNKKVGVRKLIHDYLPGTSQTVRMVSPHMRSGSTKAILAPKPTSSLP